MSGLLVEIVTPERKVFSGQASEVRAPGFHGEFGVLPGHSGFLSLVEPGVVTVVSEKGEQRFIVGRGFVEVGPDHMTMLTDHYESVDSVDRAEASALLEQSNATLGSHPADSDEASQSARDAALARARLSV